MENPQAESYTDGIDPDPDMARRHGLQVLTMTWQRIDFVLQSGRPWRPKFVFWGVARWWPRVSSVGLYSILKLCVYIYDMYIYIYYIILHYIILCYTILHYITLYYIISYHIILCYIILHYITLYYIILYYIINSV